MESKSLMASVIDTEKKADFILECLEEVFPDCKINANPISLNTNKNVAVTTKLMEILATLNIERLPCGRNVIVGSQINIL